MYARSTIQHNIENKKSHCQKCGEWLEGNSVCDECGEISI
jgi:ribosomal protein L32